jgi:hypothetical protein
MIIGGKEKCRSSEEKTEKKQLMTTLVNLVGVDIL